MEFALLFIEILKQDFVLVLIFFVIALVYSTVGFGGGSSYSAVLSLTEMSFIEIRAISLLCNIMVVSNSTYQYFKKDLYQWNKILPLVIFSVPFAFLGGFIKIEQRFFYLILGATLLLASFFMFGGKYLKNNNFNYSKGSYSIFKNALIGSFIGFLSGMVGIGGGVFLSPVLHFTKWDTSKRIVATSSFFILLNSIAGLIGQMQNLNFYLYLPKTILLLIAVFFGGFIGTKLSFYKLNVQHIKNITALLIGLVGIKIIFSHI